MAGGYDGEIRIRTLIENGDASSSLLQLESRFQKLTRESQRLTDQMRQMEQMRIPTEEYQQVQDQLNKDNAALDKLLERMERFKAVGGKTDSRTFKNMQYDAEQLSESIRYANGELQAMRDTGTAYVDPKSTTEYQHKAERLRDVNSQMEILNQRMNETADREARAGNTGEQSLGKTQKAAEKAKTAIAGMIPTVGKAKSALSSVGSAAKRVFNSIFNHTKKSGGMIEKFGKRVKKIALTILVFQWVSKAFRAMIDSIKSGIQNYAKYSGDFNQKMSELKTSATNLKNAIGAAAVPIVSALAPALTTLCNWLTKAINLLNQLFSALSGKGTWSKAKNQQVDYAKSLNGTANAAKKAKGALQGFDELNVISSNDSGSGGGGSGTTGVSYEEMPISDSIKKIKDILAGEDWTELGKIIADKLNSAMKSIPWDSIQAEAEKTGKRIGTLINGFVSEFDWNLLGYTLAQGINTALIFLNTFLETVDWTKLGSGLATGINGLVDNLDWSLLGTTISNGLNAAIDAAYGFVSTLDWGKMGQSVGQALSNAIQNIKWTEFGETIGTAVTGLLTFLDETIKNTDWKSLGQGIVDAIGGFFETLDWGVIGDTLSSALAGLCDFLSGVIDEIDWSRIPTYIAQSIADLLKGFDWASAMESVAELLFQALKAAIELQDSIWDLLESAWDNVKDYFNDYIKEAGGNVIEGLYNGILDALKNVGTWIVENIFNPFIEGFKNAFGIHSPSTVMAEMGDYIIEGLKVGLTGMWERVSDIIEKFKDNTKKSFTDVKDNVITTLNNMKEKVENIFQNMWGGVKNIINTMLGGVENMANKMIDGINAMTSALGQLSWDIPDWVPIIGGNKFGISIPPIQHVNINKLANGGITTGSTLANIGEAGREAVLPLENNLSYMKPLAEMIASEMKGVQTVRIVADEGKIFKIVREEANDYYRRTGSPAFDF